MAPKKSSAPTKPPAEGNVLRQFLFGDTTLPGDVRRILGTFNPRAIGMNERLMMRLDPDVAFGLAIVRSPIINRQWSVDGEPKIAAFVDKALRPKYRSLALGASNALAFGHQVVEKVWTSGPMKVEQTNPKTRETGSTNYPNAWTFERFKAIDPRSFNYLVEDDKVAGVAQFQVEGKKLAKEIRVGMERILHWAFHSEYNFGSPYGWALIDQAYGPWYDKTATNLLCNRYFETSADPPIKTRGLRTIRQGGKDYDGARFLLEQIAALRSGGGIYLPSDFIKGTDKWAWDVEFMQKDQRGQMMDGRLLACSIQIMRALWITDKAATAGDGTGARAPGTEAGGRRDETLESIVTEWLEVVNEQIVKPIVLYNFGEQAARDAGVCIRMAGLTATKKEVYKDVLAQLIAAEQALAAGETPRFIDLVDMAAIAEELGIPLRPMKEVQELLKNRLADSEAAAERAIDSGLPGAGGDEEITEEDERKAGDDFKKNGVEE